MKLSSLIWLLSICAAQPSFAHDPTPGAEQMVEQLKLPKTRSLRNFVVEPAQASSVTASVQPQPTLEQPTAPYLEQPLRPSLSLLIQFDFNSARVRPESLPALVNLAKALQSNELKGSKFAVEGHTDAKGSAPANQVLSQQRAQAVREFLKSRGVDEIRLVAIGKGYTELANGAQPFAAENRRVRIVNLD